jgi:hypothetical protein
MKIKNFTLLFFVSIFLILACQKELSFESSSSVGTLKSDITGDCLPSMVAGSYQADSTLNSTHFIEVDINVTIPGSYNISTDTINGYYFSAQGTSVFGNNTIKLLGKGKPLTNGSNDFTVKYGASTCLITVDVTGSVAGGAIYTLNSSPTGTCSGAIVNGTYKVGVALAATNTVSLQVTVLAPGTYRFGAVSTNGMLFTASGVFTTTGPQTVLLTGVGIPLAAGSFNLSAGNLTSMCTFTVIVAPAAASTGVYTLNGAPGVCGGAVSAGTYVVGTALAATNTIQLQVTVTTVGSYNITTNTVNGFSFTGTGNFAAVGPQSVLLIGTGTPTAAGSFNFTATAGASTCTFSVVCTGGVVPPAINLDYRPQTAFTNYSGNRLQAFFSNPGAQFFDTVYFQVSPNTINKNGIIYNIIEDKENGIPVDSFFIRKNGGQYFELLDDDLYEYFDNPFNKDVMFLDSSKLLGDSWTTVVGNNTVGGVPANLTITSTIYSRLPTSVGGVFYNQIIVVNSLYSSVIGTNPSIYVLGRKAYYAKGVGIVLDQFYIPSQTNPTAGGGGIYAFDATRTQVF